MPPALVVLTDFSPAGDRACAYAAALAAPLGAALHLVHVFSMPFTSPRMAVAMHEAIAEHVQEDSWLLQQKASELPLPATTQIIEADWAGAVAQVVAEYHPLLLVAGLTATDGPFDEWQSNRPLPLAHQTGYPLLLVPENLPLAAQHPPRRLLLAVEDRAFQLSPEAQSLGPRLDILGCQAFVATVVSPDAPPAGQAGLRAAQQCGLAAALTKAKLRQVVDAQPAAGIWQAADEVEADLVVLPDQGHGWAHKVFSGSVIADVVRYSQVPVLLLAAHLWSKTD
ncbi:universal stress protein [Hymenobacter bucti]|uniref:Universal stress protein n=1 Tax=Hymenobacter bucti TaxID=1844114 RepID=A0ABW4R023_9BACT